MMVGSVDLGVLRPYQKRAHDRIVKRKKMLLALPMGVGKTLTSIAAVETLMTEGEIVQPGVVLVPASLKYQWRNEIERWTESKALVSTGSKTERKRVYEQFRNWRESGYDYLIMTYTALVNDYDLIKDLHLGFVIADEVTALKSFSSKRSKIAKKLFEKTDIRIGLSGTPVENGKPDEIFSIMQFIDPKVLGSWWAFDSKYVVRNVWGGIEKFKNLPELNKKMADAMVRMSYSDPEISDALPDTIYTEPVEVYFDGKSGRVWGMLRDEISDALDNLRNSGQPDVGDWRRDVEGGQQIVTPELGRLMAGVTVARMFVDHPSLLEHSDASFAEYLRDKGLLDKLPAPKLDAFTEAAGMLLSEHPDSKLIVFSTFVGMLDIISDRLKDTYGVDSVTYHGALSAEEKEQRKQKFKTDPACKVFISSDAGGYGVDLPEANALINYDMPWQPGMLEQRNARPRRVSSTWEKITVTDMLVHGTLDPWQRDMLRQKAAVSGAILDGTNITASGGLDTELASLSDYLDTGSMQRKNAS